MIKSFPDDFYVININYNNLIDLPRNLLAFFLISILLQPMVCLFLWELQPDNQQMFENHSFERVTVFLKENG